MENDKVDIFMITNDNVFETKFCIDNLIKNTNYPFTLNIFNLNSSNPEFCAYLDNLKNSISCILVSIQPVKLSEIYSLILNNITQEYVVFLPSNVIVNDNWLTELKHSYQCIENSGCVSIKSNTENLLLTSVLFKTTDNLEDEMKTVFVNKTNTFNDFIFFSKDRLKRVGGFETNNELLGMEINDFSFRFLNEGYFNYYLKYNNCIRLKLNDKILYPKITKSVTNNFKEKVNKIISDKYYKNQKI
jgi:hypothetical protein